MFDLIGFIKEYSYIGIFIIIFLECGVFFLLPGDSLLFAVGIMASRGFISLDTALIFIVIAAILGGHAGYIIGKYCERLFEQKYLKKIFPKDKIEKAKSFFHENGNRTMLFCRFIPIVRTFAPIVVGFSDVSYKTFWKYNFIGGVLWGLSIPTLGYLFGESFPALEHNLGLISVLIVAVSLIPILKKYAVRKKKVL